MSFIKRAKCWALYHIRIIRLWLLWRTSSHYLVSFPKSGRTWARIFLAKYFSLHYGYPFDESFRALRPHPGVPRTMMVHSGLRGEIILKRRKGRMATQDMLVRNIKDLRNKHVILLVRDPRDAVISHYFSAKKRGKSKQLTERMKNMSVSEFVRHHEFGVEEVVSYTNAWYEARDSFKTFTLIRYEDLRADSHTHFRRLLHTFGISKVDEKKFEKALAFSSFDSMKRLEQKAHLGAIMTPGKDGDSESYKVRRGKVGGFRDYLRKNDIAYMNKALQALHPDLGYAAD